MTDLDTLRNGYEQAERDFYALDAEYTEKCAALRDEYRPRLNELGQAAADAQKTLCDAEAAAALVGREDAQDVADKLGLTLPE